MDRSILLLCGPKELPIIISPLSTDRKYYLLPIVLAKVYPMETLKSFYESVQCQVGYLQRLSLFKLEKQEDTNTHRQCCQVHLLKDVLTG